MKLAAEGNRLDNETIIAVFDSPAAADAALAELRSARVPEAVIGRRDLNNDAGFVENDEIWQGVFGDLTHAGSNGEYQVLADPGISIVSVCDVPMRDLEAVSALLRRHRPTRVERRVTITGSGSHGSF